MWTVRSQDPKTEFKNNTELIKTPKLSLTIKETKIKAQHGNAAGEEKVETAEANQHKWRQSPERGRAGSKTKRDTKKKQEVNRCRNKLNMRGYMKVKTSK